MSFGSYGVISSEAGGSRAFVIILPFLGGMYLDARRVGMFTLLTVRTRSNFREVVSTITLSPSLTFSVLAAYCSWEKSSNFFPFNSVPSKRPR